MGIPTYTRWLCRKYPLILKPLPDAESSLPSEESGSSQQPEVPKFDNFYIDMNGIIHDCAHGQVLGSIPRNTDDVLENLQKWAIPILLNV